MRKSRRMRTSCAARRPDLTLEDRIEKKIMIIDMACPNESTNAVPLASRKHSLNQPNIYPS